MKTGITRYAILTLATALLTVTSSRAWAAEKTDADNAAPKTEAPDAAPKVSRYPYRGKLTKTDKETMTISLERKESPRVIHVTSETRILKAGKPAVFDDIVIGANVTGQVFKNDKGEEVAVSLYFGARSGDTPKEE